MILRRVQFTVRRFSILVGAFAAVFAAIDATSPSAGTLPVDHVLGSDQRPDLTLTTVGLAQQVGR
jgi:hypothetical protein